MKSSIFTFLLLSLFAFSACQQNDNLNAKKEKEKKEWQKEYDKTCDKKHCFEMVYPLVWTMPDDSEISANDEKEMWTNIKSWYEMNPAVEEKPTLNYPVGIIFNNGDEKTVADEVEMIVVKKDCDDKEG